MENEEGKDGKGGCCGSGKRCCGKVLAALALLAIGGLGGYCVGRQCSVSSASPAAVEQPAK